MPIKSRKEAIPLTGIAIAPRITEKSLLSAWEYGCESCGDAGPTTLAAEHLEKSEARANILSDHARYLILVLRLRSSSVSGN